MCFGLPPAADRAERAQQDPLPDPSLGTRLPQRAQVQGRSGHVPNHEGGG